MQLNVAISGTEEIDREFQQFQTELGGKVRGALETVGEDMKFSLARHIDEDVYNAYNPKRYIRRGGNGGLEGQALETRPSIGGAGIDSSVTLDYEPSGAYPEHVDWDDVDGDALIGRIENKTPPYNWEPRGGMKRRPFWQRFVNEMTDGGFLESSFVSALGMFHMGPEERRDLASDGNVVRESGDGDY